MPPAYMTDVSPSQSRWTSPEPPDSPRNVSGTTDASPGEYASHNGPEHEAAVRQETGWNQSQGMRVAPNRFSGEASDTPPDFAHKTRNTAVFDGTKEYCTRGIVFFWQPPSCFSQWTPSRFTAEGVSYSCGEQFFGAEKKPPLRGPPDATTHHARVQPPPPQVIW